MGSTLIFSLTDHLTNVTYLYAGGAGRPIAGFPVPAVPG